MALAAIFTQAQTSLANHRKNCVNLYKIHVQAAGDVRHNSKVTVKLVGEDEFARSFLDMVSRALVVKKGVASADRIIKFVGAYVKYINEKGLLDPHKYKYSQLI
jgi:condensin complex subunit 3